MLMSKPYNKRAITMSKKDKRLQIFWYSLARLITRGCPLVAIGFIYGFVEHQDATTQLNGMLTLGILVVAWTFYKDFRERAKKFYETTWQDMVTETKMLFVSVIVLLFLQWVKTGVHNLEMLFIVIGLSQTLAIYPSLKHRKYERMELQYKEKEKDA